MHKHQLKNKLLIIITLFLLGLTSCATLKPVGEMNATELVNQADISFGKKNWENTINYLEELLSSYPYNKYSEQANLNLAYAYYKFDRAAQAVKQVDNFLVLFPASKKKDYAFYLKALAQSAIMSRYSDSTLTDPAKRDISIIEDAFKSYTRILQEFPNSKYAKVAKFETIKLWNAMARHELYTARYYFKIKSYLAVINRANIILEKYNNTQYVQDASTLLAKSYDALGLTDRLPNTKYE